MADAVLIVRTGPLAGQRIELEHDVVLGREGADVTIQDRQLSRRHAAIKLVEDGLEIEDLDSLNGTYVNAGRIQIATRLASGDVVQMGESSFEVEVEPAEHSVGAATRAPQRPSAETRAVRPAAPAPAPAREPEAPPAPARPQAQAPPAAFGAFAHARRKRRRAPATRRVTPTLLSFAVIVATAGSLVVYFAGR